MKGLNFELFLLKLTNMVELLLNLRNSDSDKPFSFLKHKTVLKSHCGVISRTFLKGTVPFKILRFW